MLFLCCFKIRGQGPGFRNRASRDGGDKYVFACDDEIKVQSAHCKTPSADCLASRRCSCAASALSCDNHSAYTLCRCQLADEARAVAPEAVFFELMLLRRGAQLFSRLSCSAPEAVWRLSVDGDGAQLSGLGLGRREVGVVRDQRSRRVGHVAAASRARGESAPPGHGAREQPVALRRA
eukprot:1527784-Pleurochrysis_carterae.AAC.1